MNVTGLVFVLAACVAVASGLSVYPYAEDIAKNASDASSTTAPAPSTSPSPAPVTSADTTTTAVNPAVETSTPKFTEEQEDDCRSQIGKVINDVPVNTMRKYDVEQILEGLGGAPGKVNTTMRKDVQELHVEDPKERPLPDTKNETYWLYDYRDTDYKTYVRVEHALLRFKGTKDEFVDIRGELYWTPPDFCDRSRHAHYRRDDIGFNASVTLEYCDFGGETPSITCAHPAHCFRNETFMSCVAAPSAALIASLVG